MYLDSRQSLFCSKICLREYLSIWVARAWIEKVQILRLYLHFLNSRRRNSHDFAAWILLLTDFWAKERLLAVYGVLYIALTTRRWPKLLSPSRLHEHNTCWTLSFSLHIIPNSLVLNIIIFLLKINITQAFITWWVLNIWTGHIQMLDKRSLSSWWQSGKGDIL